MFGEVGRVEVGVVVEVFVGLGGVVGGFFVVMGVV